MDLVRDATQQRGTAAMTNASSLIVMEGACAAVVAAYTITSSVEVSLIVGGVAVLVTAVSNRRVHENRAQLND